MSNVGESRQPMRNLEEDELAYLADKGNQQYAEQTIHTWKWTKMKLMPKATHEHGCVYIQQGETPTC